VIIGISSVSVVSSRAAPRRSKWRSGVTRTCWHKFMRDTNIASCPSFVNSSSDVRRVRSSIAHNPTKAHNNVAVWLPFKPALIEASRAALHTPLNNPKNMLAATDFRECSRKKATIFIGSSPYSHLAPFLSNEMDTRPAGIYADGGKRMAMINNPKAVAPMNGGNHHRRDDVSGTICPISRDNNRPKSMFTMRVDCAANTKNIL